MYFENPLVNTEVQDIFYLAPIPVFFKIFNEPELHTKIYNLGLQNLNDQQRLMGQELPEVYDKERQDSYKVNYNRQDMWVEPDIYSPIGSRFFTPPNDFLNLEFDEVKLLKDRIISSFDFLLSNLGKEYLKDEIDITESWMQYYHPTLGRGHNQHNHCRWSREEIRSNMFSGGYYISDGNPIKDHPYSGVLTFHVRDQQYMIRPKPGMLIIWPYDIIHSVKPFYGEEYRVVINFNIQT